MSPILPSLLKNAEVADFISLSNCLLPCRCWNHWPACEVDQGLTATWPSEGGGNESLAIFPPQCRHKHSYQARQLEKEVTGPWDGNSTISDFFRKPTSVRKPVLSPVNKSSQAEPAFTPAQWTFLSSVLPPLCGGISLIKSVWKFLWGFSSIFILGMLYCKSAS